MAIQKIILELAKKALQEQLSSQAGKSSEDQLDPDSQKIDIAGMLKSKETDSKPKVKGKIEPKSKVKPKVSKKPNIKGDLAKKVDPTKKKYNNNILQQAGRSFIGKDIQEGADPELGVWGALGRTLGDTMRGKIGLDTTGDRGATTQNDVINSILSKFASDQGIGDLNQTEQPVIGQQDPAAAFKQYQTIAGSGVGNIDTGIPEVQYDIKEGTKVGQLMKQGIRSKERLRRAGKLFDSEVDKNKTLAIDNARGIQESGEGLDKSLYNLELMSGAMSDISDLYTAAYESGGMGDAWKGLKSTIALKFGGRPAEKFKDLAALPGKVTEVVLKANPMFTQQLGKDGSVRVMKGLFEKVTESYGLPDTFLQGKNIPPKNMKNMLESSMKGFYRIAKANSKFSDAQRKELLGIKDNKTFNERVWDIANSVELTPEEAKAYGELSTASFGSLDRFIDKRDKTGNVTGRLKDVRARIKELESK